MAAFIIAAILASAQGPIQAPPPGPVEQAVIEHRCLGARVSTATSGDPYHDCLAVQLAQLRAGFGADLAGLTAAERRKLDAVCSRVRAAEGRDRYVACVSDRLRALQATRAPSGAASHAAQTAAPGHPNPESALSPPTSGRPMIIFGTAMALCAIAAGGAVFVLKRRRKASRCRSCGATFEQAGDFCPACRHAAAEARRRAAAAAHPLHN